MFSSIGRNKYQLIGEMVYRNDVPNQSSKTMKFGEDLKETTDALKWIRDPISVMEPQGCQILLCHYHIAYILRFFTPVKLLQWLVMG